VTKPAMQQERDGADLAGARLAIVVVNWNGFADTSECLESIAPELGSAPGRSCIVVDNGSSDGSVERIREAFPWVRMVPLAQNCGYAGGCNAGMRVAVEEGVDFLLLLNNDAVVEPGSLGVMMSAALDPRNHRYGMLNPIIVELRRPDHIWSAGGRVRLASCSIGNRRSAPADREQIAPCDFATGCCLLVRHQVVREIGMLDEGLFAYLEDVDWSLRARQAGWRSGVVAKARVRHRVSIEEGGVTSSTQHYYNIRNRYIILRRFGSAGQIVSGTALHTLRCLALLGGQLIRGRVGKAAMTLRAIRDGILMRAGPAPRGRK
jgi:GT2 family glycosyltransferase